jgi:hypothetical protein
MAGIGLASVALSICMAVGVRATLAPGACVLARDVQLQIIRN